MPPPAKKPKTADGDGGAPAPPPPYGTQEYWEGRYAKAGAGGGAAGDELPGHAWYFSYGDLRPILLPLLLGGREGAIGGADGGSGDGPDDGGGGGADRRTPGRDGDTKIGDDGDDGSAGDDDGDGRAGDNDGGSADDDVDDDGSGGGRSEEEGDDDGQPERPGLSADGPVAVLEVGCGDVPLGAALAADLDALGRAAAVTDVVCCDYSPAAIDALVAAQRDAPARSGPAGTIGVRVVYSVADARKMPYPDGTYGLLLEKGTLDALLSDKVRGRENCVAVVTECARVLEAGGCMVIVSHLNAHTPKGVAWLEEIIMPGLNAGGGGARWAIEVHGNDCGDAETDDGSEDGGTGTDGETSDGGADADADADAGDADDGGDDDDDDDDDENAGGSGTESGDDGGESGSPPDGPGPAVYVVHKNKTDARPTEGEDDRPRSDTGDPPAIPVRFYTY